MWFVGFTPYYTCGVWAGYDSEETLPEEGNYRSYHKILWKKVMDRLSATKADAVFRMPDGVVVTEDICEETGLIARGGCPSRTEYFAAGTAPTTYCDGDHAYWWDDDDDDDYYNDYDYEEETENTNAAAAAAAEAERERSDQKAQEEAATAEEENHAEDTGGGEDTGGDAGGNAAEDAGAEEGGGEGDGDWDEIG